MKIVKKLVSEQKVVFCIVIVAITIAFFVYEKNKEMGEETISPNQWAEPIDKGTEDVTGKQKETESVLVYKADVKGAVARPGVYEFTSGQRVVDLINLAGGFTELADTKTVNLAKLVTDELVIYVPVIGESGTDSQLVDQASTETKSAEKININTATKEQFDTLPGIGPSKADAIIQKREELGQFKSTEDLKSVVGIGEKTFEKFKDLITVQ